MQDLLVIATLIKELAMAWNIHQKTRYIKKVEKYETILHQQLAFGQDHWDKSVIDNARFELRLLKDSILAQRGSTILGSV